MVINWIIYLHDIWTLKVVWWEYLQFELVWNVSLCTILRLILIIDQIWNYIRFSNVYKEAIPYDNWPLQFSKGTISLTQITDFVQSVKWVELNIKLPTLMVVSTTHHWIYWRLFLACIWIVRVVAWDNEIIHFLLKDLLTSCVFDVTTCGTSSIFATDIIFIVLDSIFNTKIGESIEVLPPRSKLIPGIERLTLLWHNTHWIDHHGEVFFQMSWA